MVLTHLHSYSVYRKKYVRVLMKPTQTARMRCMERKESLHLRIVVGSMTLMF
jgi:hypothetical protein